MSTDKAVREHLKSFQSGLLAISTYSGSGVHLANCEEDGEGAPCTCGSVEPKDIADALLDQIGDLERAWEAAAQQERARLDECEQACRALLEQNQQLLAEACSQSERASLEANRVRYLLQVPMWKREGREPVEAHKPCLYTLVQTCREMSDDPDQWCGFCSGTNVIPVAVADPARDLQAEGDELFGVVHPPPTPEDR